MQFAYKTIDITPDQPLPLAGWSSRTKAHTSVEFSLEANIALFDYEGSALLMVCIDSLFVSSKLREHILKSLKKKDIAFNSQQLIIFASHTHFAPNLDEDKPLLGKVNHSYIDHCFQSISDGILELFNGEQKTISIEYKKGKYERTINRRQKQWQGGKNPLNWHYKTEIAPNPLSNINKDIHLFTIKDNNDQTIAFLWSIACHPVDYKSFEALSSNYIGYVRQALRSNYTNKLPVFFIQGFAGNIRADLFKHNSIKGKLSSLIGKRPKFNNPSNNYLPWCEDLSKSIIKLDARDAKKQTLVQPKVKLDFIPLKKLINDHSGNIKDLKLSHFKLCKSLTFISLSAEPVNEYVKLIEKKISGQLIPCAYNDNTFGYLPIGRQVKEGGYEAEGFFKWFNIKGHFKETPEDIILNQIDLITK